MSSSSSPANSSIETGRCALHVVSGIVPWTFTYTVAIDGRSQAMRSASMPPAEKPAMAMRLESIGNRRVSVSMSAARNPTSSTCFSWAEPQQVPAFQVNPKRPNRPVPLGAASTNPYRSATASIFVWLMTLEPLLLCPWRRMTSGYRP